MPLKLLSHSLQLRSSARELDAVFCSGNPFADKSYPYSWETASRINPQPALAELVLPLYWGGLCTSLLLTRASLLWPSLSNDSHP